MTYWNFISLIFYKSLFLMPSILLSETKGKGSGRKRTPIYFVPGARKWCHCTFLKSISINFFFPAARMGPLPHTPYANSLWKLGCFRRMLNFVQPQESKKLWPIRRRRLVVLAAIWYLYFYLLLPDGFLPPSPPKRTYQRSFFAAV